jgi:cell division protein FtsW
VKARTRSERRAAEPSKFGRKVRAARGTWKESGRRRPPAYIGLLSTVAVLTFIGLVMVLSSSSVEALANYGSSWLFFKRQLLWTVLGLLTLVAVSRVDYHSLRRVIGPLLIISTVLLLAVLVPGVGVSVNGSTRWLGVGPLRFQPSELAKLALLLYSADLLTRRAGQVNDWRAVLRPIALVFGFYAALVMLQPDMGTTICMGAVTVTVMFVGGIRLSHMGLVGVVGGFAGTVLAFSEPYRRARLMSFVDPFSAEHVQNGGYQVAQSLIALGEGRWTGVGLGAGRAKWLFLPNAHTDFIFAVIGEELGLLGSLLVVALFGTLAVLGVRTAMAAPDRFGTLLAAGITGWICAQAMVNIGTVVGLLPVTGVPLPFVSFGGSALVFTMAATGVLLNIARQGRLETRPQPVKTPSRSREPVPV